MIIPKLAIPRRTVLRGLGATLALPLLERMVPTTALARAATTAVARFCTVYVPNGIVMERWTPETEGTGFAFTPTLKPLEPYREHLLLLSGLDNTGARSRSGASGAHAKSAGAFMTGIEPLPTTGSSSLSLGISMDQIIANTLGQETPLPSLELGLEGADTVNGVGTCDVGFSCAYQNRLAWSGPSTPRPVETNPRVVFDRLFGNVDSTDPVVRRARLRRQNSIIDSVLDKVERLQGDLGRRDRAKLDEYLQSVREIERRIQNAEAQGRELPLVESPAGIPVSYDEHARLMFDMQTLALQTDTTRVITFQIGREQRVWRRSTPTTRTCSPISSRSWPRPATATRASWTTSSPSTAAPSARATAMTSATCRFFWRGAGPAASRAGGTSSIRSGPSG